MRILKTVLSVLVVFVVSIVLSGCGGGGGGGITVPDPVDPVDTTGSITGTISAADSVVFSSSPLTLSKGMTPKAVVGGVRVYLEGTNYWTTAAPDGTYTFTDIPPGNYVVVAERVAEDGTRYKDREEATVEAGVEQQVDPVIDQTGQIRGKVTLATGTSPKGITVFVPESTISTKTDVNGEYILDDLAPGTYDLSYFLPEYSSPVDVDLVVAPGAITHGPTKILEPAPEPPALAILQVTVNDDEGQPLEDVIVKCQSSSSVTGVNGTAVIGRLTAAASDVFVSREGFVNQIINVSLAAGTTTNRTVSLLPEGGTILPGSISGIVKDKDVPATVLQDITVSVDPPAVVAVLTDSNGAFSLTDLPPGAYTVRFSDVSGTYRSVYKFFAVEEDLHITTNDVLLINESNDNAPVFDGTPVTGNNAVAPGATQRFEAHATDVDGDFLNYTWETIPANVGLFDPSSKEGPMVYWTAPSQRQVLTLKVTVTDGFNEDSATYVLDNIPPSQITDFAAVDGEEGQVSLSWSNPAGAAEITVCRKTGSYPADHSDGTQVYTGTNMAYVDTSVTNGTTYYYGVFSRDSYGNWNDALSVGWNGASATPVDLSAPVVSNTTITSTADANGTAVALSWTAASDDTTAAGSLRYAVYYSTDSNIATLSAAQANGNAHLWQTLTGTVSTTITGLNQETQYWFNVFAIDQADNSSAYAVDTATTADATAPADVQNFVASDGENGQVTLTWTNPSDTDLASVVVRRQTGSYPTSNTAGTLVYENTSPVPGGAEAPAADTGLTNSTAYYYGVFCSDSNGNWTASIVDGANGDVGTPLLAVDGTAPAQIADFAASNGEDSQSTLTWTNPSDGDLSEVVVRRTTVATPVDQTDGVLAYRSTAPVASAAVNYVNTGLANGTTYYYAVFSKDTSGNWNTTVTAANSDTGAPADTLPPVPQSTSLSLAAKASGTEVDVTFSRAVDSTTAETALTYTVYYSTSNNIGTVANAETNGTALTPTSGHSTATIVETVSGLTSQTMYWFNVVVEDGAGLKSSYTTASASTVDITVPVAGGAIVTSNKSATGLTLTWPAATDTYSAQANVQYRVYYSSVLTDVSSYANASSNAAMAMDWSTAVTTVAVNALSQGVQYHFNVFVRDEAGNIGAYTPVSDYALDGDAPVAASYALTLTPVSVSSINVAFAEAIDVVSSAEFQVYYSEAPQLNIDTLARLDTAISAGTVTGPGWAAYSSPVTITGLDEATAYDINVVTRDASGNRRIYNMGIATTLDATAPVPGSTGTITTANITGSSLTLNWTAATDNGTAQSALEYIVYQSASDNISTYALAFGGNGTLVQNWTANITTVDVSGLDDGLTYYFNVFVRDTAGTPNVADYAGVSGTTLDVTAPTPGSSGTITTASVTGSSLTLNWTAATDTISAQANLEYIVYQSESDNIGTWADAQANGTLVQNWTANVTTANATGLDDGTTYFFNVFVRDEAATPNVADYTAVSDTTLDITAPVAGNSGTITTASVAGTSLTLNWTAATDNVSAGTALEYIVYRSTSDNISTWADAQANGTLAQDWTANIVTANITGLTEGTTYYFNVFVRDTAATANVGDFAGVSETMPDVTAPVPGNMGTIATASVTGSSLTLNWTAATDNVSAGTALEYIVYQSESDNIGTWADAQANGTLVQNWTANIATANVTGLTDGTTYYFNVFVRDEASTPNIADYAGASDTTLDTTAPVAGNSGTITTASVTGTSLTLNWTAATDNFSDQANLQYIVYRSTSDNISTYALASGGNGTLVQDWTANIATANVTGLTDGTPYYFNVFVRDEAAAPNVADYAGVSGTTLDITAPVPGSSGTVATANVAGTSLDLNWTAATDNVSAGTALEYIVYQSESDNIGTWADAQANGTLVQNWTANIATANVTGLTDGTTYYFNVFVRDEAATPNVADYAGVSETTLDITAPAAGNSGTIATATVAGTSLTLNWTVATDAVSAGTALEYLVYYSTSDNIDTVANAESNGTAVDTYAANIATKDVTGLSEGTTYYFNVLVQDEAGNKTAYAGVSETTLDVTAPVPGNSGTITTANVAGTSLTLNWTAATDNVADGTALQYIVYQSTSDNISTYALASGGNGTLVQDWTANTTTANVTGLTDATTYWFNVFVRDEAGTPNVANYTSLSETTLDVTAPVAGNSGTLATAGVGATSLTLSWTAATDNGSAQANLEYIVYRSAADNIDTYADAQTNGTLVRTWTADSTTVGVTGLDDGTPYYFNVFVRDEAATPNVADYVAVSETTVDVTAPVPGNSGTITTANVAGTSLTLNWTASVDNTSATTSLQYIVYRSLSNDISTYALASGGNGTLVQDWTANITTVNVTGLADGTEHWFNVFVRDTAGTPNVADYVMMSETTPDGTPPTVGGGGTLVLSGETGSSVNVGWTAATDTLTTQSLLEYRVYYSTSNNIDTVANMTANGTMASDWTANQTNTAVSGLSDGTQYWFNVVVRDENNNTTAYTMNNTTTLDTTDPVPGNTGTITTANVAGTSLDLNWSVASDNVTTSTALEYLAYYSALDNIDTVANAEANGTAVGTYTANSATVNVTGLSEGTQYWFNVLVRDAAGNKVAYGGVSETTLDVTNPVPGNSGSITIANVAGTSLDLNWSVGSDNVTTGTALEYLAYYSTSDNIDTVANAESNGTAVGSYAANIATKNVSGLSDATTYWFNVVVRDAAGNKAAYTTVHQMTADITGPTPGNSGALTTASIAGTSLTLNWTVGSDDVSAGAALEYLAYYSTSNDIDSVANAELNGTAVGSYTANIATKDVTGLTDATTYYFNVVFRDEAGNKSVYTTVTGTTVDVTNPVPGNSGIITTANVSGTALDLNWSVASDNGTTATALQYIVYRSLSNDISTYGDAQTNGTLVQDWTANLTTVNVTGLADGTEHWFNVFVRDEAATPNVTDYVMISETTPDGTAPVAGDSGTITLSGETGSSVDCCMVCGFR